MAKKDQDNMEKELETPIVDKLKSTIVRSTGRKDLIKTADKIIPKGIISTGFKSLDNCIGGGFQRGRISQLYGGYSVGKTTIILQVIKKAIDEGLTCLYIDAEHKFNPNYAEMLGIDMSKLLILDLMSEINIKDDDKHEEIKAEELFNIIYNILTENKIDICVLDSIVSIATEREGTDLRKGEMMSLPNLLSRALKLLVPAIDNSDCVFIAINQARVNIVPGRGAMGMRNPGGNALDHHLILNLYLRRLKKKEVPSEVIFTVEKHKQTNVTEGDTVSLMLSKSGFTDTKWFEEAIIRMKEVGLPITSKGLKVGKKIIPNSFLKSLGEEKLWNYVESEDINSIFEAYNLSLEESSEGDD